MHDDAIQFPVMDYPAIKRMLQDSLGAGVVVIVGSGLSCAEGLPGMWALKEHLEAKIPARAVNPSDREEWDEIAKVLATGADLESALLRVPPGASLEALIVAETDALVRGQEGPVLEKVLGGGVRLRFGSLVRHLTPTTAREIHVITPNYDRLIEVACELEGIPVDTLFDGGVVGRVGERDTKWSFIKDFSRPRRGGAVIVSYRTRVVLAKPHGSLDWYRHNDAPIRTNISVPHPSLIITPGGNKYYKGYDSPFDRHRERANQWIDRASGYLILGYGFNDAHLQTHLLPRLRSGVPGLVVTHSLTPEAQALLAGCPKVVTVVALPKDAVGSVVTVGVERVELPGEPIWDLQHFVERVLEP